MSILLIIILLSFFIFSFLVLCMLIYYMLFVFAIPMISYGAIFANSRPERVKRMVSLADAKQGEKAIDLGSGDGRLVIALARAGAEVHGYEINPLLVLLAKRNIKNAGLKDKAFVHWKNFWNEDLSEFNIIAIYGISYIMQRLEEKLKKELKPGSRVVSNYFTFPAWRYHKKDQDVYLYKKAG